MLPKSILGSDFKENKTFPAPPSPSRHSTNPICEPFAGLGAAGSRLTLFVSPPSPLNQFSTITADTP